MSETALLAALHESPDDELTWSALADWLDDAGQGDRAELVRLFRALRALSPRRSKARSAREARVAALLAAGVKPAVPEVVNSVGMRLALVPAGTFQMGAPRGQTPPGAQQPHVVRLTRPYYLGAHSVTQAQYAAVTGKNPSYFSPAGDGSDRVAGLNTSDFPVERVSWDEATKFCRLLSERDGRAYRLPTEAEWEYACRAAATCSTAYHYGDKITTGQANITTTPRDDTGRTCPVGSYPPNLLGLYDMHGNVWEWCADWHGDTGSGPAVDPRGPADGTARVLRGGSWLLGASYCRSNARAQEPPASAHRNVGFRVALDHPAGGKP